MTDTSNNTDPTPGGVQLDLINGSQTNSMTSMEKIRLIIDSVRDGNIVILESGLEPQEEAKLIEVTMSEIQPDGFTGIEIESYPSEDGNDKPGFVDRVLGRDTDPSTLAVIGPADKMETLHKDNTIISTLVSGE